MNNIIPFPKSTNVKTQLNNIYALFKDEKEKQEYINFFLEKGALHGYIQIALYNRALKQADIKPDDNYTFYCLFNQNCYNTLTNQLTKAKKKGA